MIFYAIIGIPVSGMLYAFLGEFFGRVVSNLMKSEMSRFDGFSNCLFFSNSLYEHTKSINSTNYQRINSMCRHKSA